MDLALRDLGPLAAARRKGTTLEAEKTNPADAPAAPGPNVATGLEALRAVLPATLITLYTTGVLLLQNVANAAGAGGRAAEQAALATKHGAGTPALEAALAALSVEPPALAWARVLFAVVFTVLVIYYAYNKAQTVPGRRVYLEPFVTSSAFVAWAVASPGTFLAAYMNATQLAVATILIAILAAGALWVVSETKLKKKSS